MAVGRAARAAARQSAGAERRGAPSPAVPWQLAHAVWMLAVVEGVPTSATLEVAWQPAPDEPQFCEASVTPWLAVDRRRAVLVRRGVGRVARDACRRAGARGPVCGHDWLVGFGPRFTVEVWQFSHTLDGHVVLAAVLALCSE